jgi:quercetin dioxygenase-like cupin family protein
MNQPGRERRGPVERFAGSEHLFNLAASAATLRSEDQVPRQGHRQITLIHDGGISVVLFDFEPGGRLSNHSADGLVIIQAIAGMLEVVTSSASHTVPAGSLLVLAAGVVHDVHARHPSQMLLTIHLRPSCGTTSAPEVND